MPKKSETRPGIKRSHGWYIGVFIAGTILPPIAVAMRFGFTRDFFINVFLTICGYFPSHIHNFYLQNIRNNTNRGRTPQWAITHGLIAPDKIQSQSWANKYSERNNDNIYEDDGTASIHSAASIRRGGGGGIKKARADRYGIHSSTTNGSSKSSMRREELNARDLEIRDPAEDDARSLRLTTSRHSFSSTHSQSITGVHNSAPRKKKSGMLKGLFGGGGKKDRFEKERDARGETAYGNAGGQPEYLDDFEREINAGSAAPPARGSAGGGDGYDIIDNRSGGEARRTGGGRESAGRGDSRRGVESAGRDAPLAQRVDNDGLHHNF